MDLVEFKAGDIVLSSDVNSNFNYLDSKIRQLSTYISNRMATFTSKISKFQLNLNELNLKKSYFLPVGTIILYPSSEVPDGFLVCDGGEYSKGEFPDLYDVIKDNFGTSESPTSFCVPSLNTAPVVGTQATNKYSYIIKY